MGSAALYQFVNDHPDLELHPSDWVNDPVRIARNHRMVSINGARMIDLTGEAGRDSSGHPFLRRNRFDAGFYPGSGSQQRRATIDRADFANGR